MASFGDALRGFGSVLNPQVAQEVAGDERQQQAQQNQIGMLMLHKKLEEQSPEYQAKIEALKNEKLFREEVAKSDGDMSKMATAAMKYGKPEIAANIFKAHEDRAARLQMASENVENRKLQLEQLHEQALSRITDSQTRAEESARHNRSIERLTEQGNTIKQQLADFNAPQGPGASNSVDNVAQMIADGKIAPLGGFAMKTPWGQQVMSKVSEINPDYRGQDFATKQTAEKAFTTGKQGNSVRSFNVAIAHLDTLDNLADAMQNGNMQMANKIANAFATATGGTAPNNFEAAKQIVGDEIVKAIVGAGGGVSDREKAQKTVDAANSPAQLRGVINVYKELMKGQLGGLKQQYETSTGRVDFETRFLSKEAKDVAKGSSTKVVDFGSLK